MDGHRQNVLVRLRRLPVCACFIFPDTTLVLCIGPGGRVTSCVRSRPPVFMLFVVWDESSETDPYRVSISHAAHTYSLAAG